MPRRRSPPGSIAASGQPVPFALGVGDEDRELEVDINKQSDSQSTFRQRRARLETSVLFVASAVVVASTAYAISWSTTGADTAQSPVDGPTLRPTKPSATAAPNADALALGETFSGTRASSTVLEVDVLDASDELAAPEGEAWVGLRIKRCASETQSSARAPYARWVVVDEDGETYPGDNSAPDGIVAKMLTTKDFPAGQCRSGWVVIGVPDAAADAVAAVRFVPPAGKSAEWTVPAS